ncbi:MAG: hypothetical protein JO235_25490 [Chroococcidiopsidaceae cyanobacterium CP_BM_RX_35]|nr:hypothetical protein [Chroococcidiopsidaceae cyanobacterium CP_BM_RX_35]
MNQQVLVQKKRKGQVKNTTLLLFAVSTAFYARILCSVTHAPSFLIHLHFFIVPIIVGIILATSPVKDRQQLSIVRILLAGLLLLFGVMTASALLNQAGFVNVIFDFMMLAESFILLLAIVSIPMSSASIEQFRSWLIKSSFINMILAFIQYPLINSGKIYANGLDGTDGMAGVFFVSGAGNYVSTTVSIYFGWYYFLFTKVAPLWFRLTTLFFAFYQEILSDSKQVLGAILIGWVLLALINVKDLSKALKYLTAIAVVLLAFYWGVENLEFLGAFKNYADKKGAYDWPNGEAWRIKLAAFRIIPTFYQSPLNWLFGLGPGHTVGRLGGWLIKENWKILGPLGATQHPASDAMLHEYYHSWLALESTMFCPLYSWAGIWGDLGLVGLGAYLFLGYLVWRYLCQDNLSKFILITVCLFGLIFTQMEEPGYMLFTAAMIGLRWQEARLGKTVVERQGPTSVTQLKR